MLEAARVPARSEGVLGDLVHHRAVAPRRHPDSQPTIAEPACTPDCGIGPAADGDRDGRLRRRNDLGVANREELAVTADRFAVGQRAQELQRLVRSASARGGVNATDLELVRIFATDPDAEGQPARCQLGDAGELACHQHGVSQRKQVQRHITGQFWEVGEQRGRVDQRVCSCADEKAHMVADAHVIDAGLANAIKPRAALLDWTRELADGGEDAHSNFSHVRSLALHRWADIRPP